MPGLELLLTPENLATYLTLTFLEIVLAGDNLVLIAILASRLPEDQRPLARRIGLFAAVATRLLLLLSLFWLSHLHTPLAMPWPGGEPVTVTPRLLIFTIGGAFLIWKSVTELLRLLFGHEGGDPRVRAVATSFAWVIAQIAFFDIIFSLDSVIAAIGIANEIEIMVAAVLTATLVMVVLVNPISEFIERHQIVKVAALNLLVLIGVHLLTEGLGFHVSRVEIYLGAALLFALQILILWLRRQAPMLLNVLIIGGTLALGAVAVMMINDPALAKDVQDRVVAAWQGSVNALSGVVDSVERMMPGGT